MHKLIEFLWMMSSQLWRFVTFWDVLCRWWSYLGRELESWRDVTEASRCAVLPGSVVLVPVTMATSHRCDFGNVKQEEEEERLHPDGASHLVYVFLTSLDRRQSNKEEWVETDAVFLSLDWQVQKQEVWQGSDMELSLSRTCPIFMLVLCSQDTNSSLSISALTWYSSQFTEFNICEKSSLNSCFLRVYFERITGLSVTGLGLNQHKSCYTELILSLSNTIFT